MAGSYHTRDVDSGWAWVALLVCPLNLVLFNVFNTAIGIIQVEVLETFSGSQGFVALICSCAFSGQTIYGPVAGMVSDLLTHRVAIIIGSCLISLGLVCASFSQDLVTLLVLYGLVCGLGSGMSYTPSLTVVMTFFHKYRTLVSGISLAGPGLGYMLSPIVVTWLIDNNGWRLGMVYLAGIMVQACVLATLMFPKDDSYNASCFGKICRRSVSNANCSAKASLTSLDNEGHRTMQGCQAQESKFTDSSSITALSMSEMGSVILTRSTVMTDEHETGSVREGSNKSQRVLCQPVVWILCLNQALVLSGANTHHILFPAFARGVGMSGVELSTLFTAFGVGLVLSRLLFGFVFNFLHHQYLLRAFLACQISAALALGLLPFCGDSFAMLLASCLLSGICIGPVFMLLTPVLLHYVEMRHLSVAMGTVLVGSGLGTLISPPVAGLVYDAFGSYSASYYFIGIWIASGSLVLIPLIVFIKPLDTQDDPGTHSEEDLEEKVIVNRNNDKC